MSGLRTALSEAIQAIEGGIVIEDRRGVVYQQEFGIAFVEWLKQSLVESVSDIPRSPADQQSTQP